MTTTIIIMRHGLRADTAGETWQHKNIRPWDAPLARKGWTQVMKVGDHLSSVISKPDVIFSSPYIRCLQTASLVLKSFGLSYDRLAIDRGLSESYDWFNAVRYVNSEDIVSNGRYRNMGDWFFCCRQLTDDYLLMKKWKLVPCLSMQQIIRSGVYDELNEANSKRVNIKEYGEFPNYEMTVNIGYNDGVRIRRERYVNALTRCLGILQKVKARKQNKVIMVVTHMAGVGVLYEHLLKTTPAAISTAGYFVVQQENGGPFRLVKEQM